jgi:2-keto-4-pentenoate hydratase
MRRILLAAVANLGLATSGFAACPDPTEIAAMAGALTSGRVAEPFSPPLTMADAQCARDGLVPLLAPSFGRPIGYKVGAAGEATQRRYGLSGPVWGVLFAGATTTRSGATVPLTPALAGLSVEADLLVRVRDAGINRAGTDHVALLRHLDQVIPFVELPRAGIARVPDGIALVSVNVSSRLGVVGRPIPVQATPEFAARLGSMVVTFHDDGKEIARETGATLLGHPLNALSWLVADLAKQGKRLNPGDIVSLGGFAPSVPAVAGHSYEQRYEGLAAQPISVSVRFR